MADSVWLDATSEGPEWLAIPIARVLAPLLPGIYRPVHAQAVALALVRTVPAACGVVVLPSDELVRLGTPAP